MLKFIHKHGNIKSMNNDCVVLSLVNKKLGNNFSNIINNACASKISEAVTTGDICTKKSQASLLYGLPGYFEKRVILVNCDYKTNMSKELYIKVVISTAQKLKETNSSKCLLNLHMLPVKGTDLEWKVETLIYYFNKVFYSFNQFKTNIIKKKDISIIIYDNNDGNKNKIKHGLKYGKALSDGYKTSSDLANMPGNSCTPEFLAHFSEKLSKDFPKLKTKVFKKPQLTRQGFGGLLSVGKGSTNDPRFIIMEYKPKKHVNKKPIVFVGKGITFDTGGISIKPSKNMEAMKYDMTASAILIGLMELIAKLDLPIHVVSMISAAENMPSSSALKPGDVITSLSGKTIEIINTDAEGRLVLCDALTYAKKYDPKVVIDLATLTGNIILALGDSAAGLMTNDENLAASIEKAGVDSLDRVWRLPLWDEYSEKLNSSVADIKNLNNDGYAGAIIAAAFLKFFVDDDYRWAHLDIAGVGFNLKNDCNSTGRPLPMLFQYLKQEINNENK